MKVVGIYVTRSMRDDPVAVEGATLVQGLGVRSSESEEDRYFGCGREPGRKGSYSHKPEPGRQVTLISSLALDGVLDGFGGVSVRDCRRNVEISASPEDLNALVGSEIRLGKDAVVFAHRRTVPCVPLARRLLRKRAKAGEGAPAAPGPNEIVEAMWDKGGISCEVVRTGEIEVGDAVVGGARDPSRIRTKMPPEMLVRPSLRPKA